MTLQDRLADAKARSVKLYLQRAALEQQRQHLTAEASLTDQAMLRLDGEIELLDALITEASRG